MKHISSRDNPTFKQVRALVRSGRERRREGRTVLDGLHLVQTYAQRVGAPECVVVSETGLNNPEIAAWVTAHPNLRTLTFADTLFADASPVDTPTGIAAVIAIPPAPAWNRQGDCVVLESVQDAGNLGSILRSAAAAGIADVLLTPGCAQAWSPRVLRAGMGAHFALRIHEHADAAMALSEYPGTVIATAADGPVTLHEADLRGDTAWLFGAEGAGLSEDTARLARQRVRIPMSAGVESLNVAAAAAVCLFEQRRVRTHGHSDEPR